jgi:hypothetical protein
MRGGDLAIDTWRIICAVAGERGDGTINLIEQGTDLRAVVDMVGGQRRRDDLASVCINPDVQFTPRPAPAAALSSV